MNRNIALNLNVAAAKTVELVAAYNLLTGKSIKKFESRSIAEARTAAAITAAAITAAHERCPFCNASESSITAAGTKGAAAERLLCHECGAEFHQDGRKYRAPAANADRAAAIAASWQDKEVAAARVTRHSVKVRDKVDGASEQYQSVRAAFEALGLPLGRHIRFRGELKVVGKLTFDDRYAFTLVQNQQ
jgi:transposase-like protein